MTCITTYCRIRARSRCQGQKMMGCHNGATRKNTCLIILVYPQRIKRRLCRGCSLQEQQGWLACWEWAEVIPRTPRVSQSMCPTPRHMLSEGFKILQCGGR